MQIIDLAVPPLTIRDYQNEFFWAFSVILTVRNLGRPRIFYEKIGFLMVGDDASQEWQIVNKEAAALEVFEHDTLTFNPG